MNKCENKEKKIFISLPDDTSIKYLHEIRLLNNDKSTIICWVSVINSVPIYTINDFKLFLRSKNYTNINNTYSFTGGGCSTEYIFRNTSGSNIRLGSSFTGFFIEDNVIKAKHSFNNFIDIEDEDRFIITTHSLTGNVEKYLHEIRFLNQSQTALAYWIAVIDNNPTMSTNEFKQYLFDNNYTSQENAYCLFGGGSSLMVNVKNTSNQTVGINSAFTGVYVVNNKWRIKHSFNNYIELSDSSRIRILNLFPLS